MPTFSKFISGRTGCQQLLDSDGHIYHRKKDKDSALKSASSIPEKESCRSTSFGDAEPHFRSPGRDIACSEPDSPQHHVLGQSNPTFQSYSIRILPTPGGYYIRSSEDLTLPPTCTSTRRDEPFVLYDGSTDRGVRVIIFATSRNMDGTCISLRILEPFRQNHSGSGVPSNLEHG